MHATGKNDVAAGADGARDSAETDKHDDSDSDLVIKLDDSTQQTIGQQLKAMYSEIVRQPIPDQFLQLLDELERKEKGQ